MKELFGYSIVKTEILKNCQKKNAQLKKEILEGIRFIKEIESGNLDATLEESKGELLESLVSMRDKMKSLSQAEAQRNWTTEGLAKFAEILRNHTDNLEKFGDQVIAGVVKYLNANQGKLFILNNDNPSDPYLELIACYAFNRKKHLRQRIEPGEGLAGQAFLEKETINLKKVPEDYIRITSGLGDAPPRHVLIVPLKINDDVFGVLEIASFETFENYHIDFLEKLGENIASTIYNVRNNARMKQLLEISQQKTEELRAQEEEMRQNLEELQATQEELQRQKEAILKAQTLTQGLIEGTQDAILILDSELKIQIFNKAASQLFGRMGVLLATNIPFLPLFQSPEREQNETLLQQVLKGNTSEREVVYEFQGKKVYNWVSYFPIFSQDKSVYAIGIIAHDITVRKEQEERLLQQSLEIAMSEKLKQHVEELEATQRLLQAQKNAALRQKNLIEGIINGIPEGILVLDIDYNIIMLNKTAKERYAGLKVQENIHFLDIIPDESYRQAVLSLLEKAKSGEVAEVESYYTLESEKFYYKATYFPIFGDEKNVIAIGLLSIDITQRKKHEETIQMQNEQLQSVQNELNTSIIELETIKRDLEQKTLEVEKVRKEEQMHLESRINDMETQIKSYKKNEKDLRAYIAKLEEEIKHLKQEI